MNAVAEAAAARACGMNTKRNTVNGRPKTLSKNPQKKQIDNIKLSTKRIKSSKNRQNRTLLVQISYILHHCCKFILF